MTPLMAASRFGLLDIVKLLIDAGADVNAADKERMTALRLACEHYNPQIVRALIAAGAHLKWTFMGPSLSGSAYMNTVKALIEAGADVNGIVRNSDNLTLLMSAVAQGNTGVVKSLIAAGADVNAKDNDGKTALMHACDLCERWQYHFSSKIITEEKGKAERILGMLLKAGADVNAKDNEGNTALDMVEDGAVRKLLLHAQNAKNKQRRLRNEQNV